MVSGLFAAKTVVHLSTAVATASFEHAVAVLHRDARTQEEHDASDPESKRCFAPILRRAA